MEEGSNNKVVYLVNKFKQATIDLGDANEVVVCNHENNNTEEEDPNWEAITIEIVIMEGRMSYQTIEKWICFTWPFISENKLECPNIMLFKFNK